MLRRRTNTMLDATEISGAIKKALLSSRKLRITFEPAAAPEIQSLIIMAEAGRIELGEGNALMSTLEALASSGRWPRDHNRTVTVVLTLSFSSNSNEGFNSEWLKKHLTGIVEKIEVI